LGKFYYFNVKTKRSQWVRPRFRQNGTLRRGLGFGDAHVAVTDAEKSGKRLSRKKKEQLLGKPEYRSDWEQHEDKSGSGKKFWWNKVTGSSRWVKPNFMSEREAEEARRRETEEARSLKEDEGAMLKEAGSAWEVCFVESSADAYYYNASTGESVWELDVDSECKLAAAMSGMSHLNTGVLFADETGTPAVASPSYVNPADWELNQTETGDPYWYNVVTGESSWTDPRIRD
jgi:hypothetical protein